MFSATFPNTPWLLREEHRSVVYNLLRLGLLKFSKNRDLPLKSGGETDIYISLRDARNSVEAVEYISSLFALALNRIRPERFVEIPDSVSIFAGTIMKMTGITCLTIREQVKAGRATSAKVIGHAPFGSKVVIIDDVITDGGSKFEPLMECLRLGLDVLGLIVLVDRQQGWRQNFAARGIPQTVWPGMTLHDVRRELIDMGLMERCDPAVEDNNPMVLALDDMNWEEVLPIIDPLRTTGTILKVNDLAFGLGSEWLMANLWVYGRPLLDWKLNDIPNTVANTCRRLLTCPPWGLTIHGLGGPDMIREALKTLRGTSTKIFVVTVLTSIDEKTGKEIFHRLPFTQVMDIVSYSYEAGARAFVCSPDREAAAIRRKYPDVEILCPGCRSPGASKNDQSRVKTFAEAQSAGANYFVGGRQFTKEAPNTLVELRRVRVDELGLAA